MNWLEVTVSIKPKWQDIYLKFLLNWELGDRDCRPGRFS